MKKSTKILLYGLLASILLILLCLYLHQDEFMNVKKDVIVESKRKNESIENIKENSVVSIENSEIYKRNELKKEETQKKLDTPVNKPTIEVEEKTSAQLEKSISAVAMSRPIFKRKEELTLKEHVKIKPVQKVSTEKVDNNLPILDNKPIVDNSKSKVNEKKSKKEKKKKELKPNSKISKKLSSKRISSIQKRISKITNHHVNFYKNKAKITARGQATLNKVIKILKTVPNAKIIVKGYTDASGRAKTNLWISQERAKSVRRYLGQHGIPLKHIVAKGFGERKLLYRNKPYSELNRRVEIEIKRR